MTGQTIESIIRRECKVTQCKKNQAGFCPEASCTSPDLFSKFTGKCPLCQHDMRTHSECEACGILIGLGYLEVGLVTYRYHQVCTWCRKTWEMREKVLGRPVRFEEYVRPDLGKK